VLDECNLTGNNILVGRDGLRGFLNPTRTETDETLNPLTSSTTGVVRGFFVCRKTLEEGVSRCDSVFTRMRQVLMVVIGS